VTALETSGAVSAIYDQASINQGGLASPQFRQQSWMTAFNGNILRVTAGEQLWLQNPIGKVFTDRYVAHLPSVTVSKRLNVPTFQLQ
jgi:hypothetical protein